MKIAEASPDLGLRAGNHDDFKAALVTALDHVGKRRGPAPIDVAVRPD